MDPKLILFLLACLAGLFFLAELLQLGFYLLKRNPKICQHF